MMAPVHAKASGRRLSMIFITTNPISIKATTTNGVRLNG